MVKVELLKNEKNGSVKLAFETNDNDGLEVIDIVRVAMLGDFAKRGAYINSRRLVIEIDDILKKPEEEDLLPGT